MEGIGTQRRSTQPNSSHVGASEANRRAMPTDECRSGGTPSHGEGPDARGETFWFLLGRLPKGLAVRAKPQVAVTAAMDMYPTNKNRSITAQ